MRIPVTCLLMLAAPVLLQAYTRDPDSGLYFPPARVQPADAVDSLYHGVKTALLIAPDDIAEPRHYSNSSMARVVVHDIAAGGKIDSHVSDGSREQVFVILAGQVEFTVDGETFAAAKEDVVVIPPGADAACAAAGAAPARLLQADWTHPALERKTMPAVLTSGKLRPMQPTNGKGYLTVAPNARQEGNRLSIQAFGAGHINARNALLLYPADIPGERPFAANTRLARMGLSEYDAGGGTRWHFHPDREQCFVILAGRALFEIGANTIEVSAGDIIFAPRHVGHGYMTVGDEPFRFFELEWGR